MPFVEDTTRFVGSEGSYAIEIPRELAAEPGALSGGVVAALAVRAAQLETSKPEPTSLVGHLLRPVPPAVPLTFLVSKPAERPGAESIAVTAATDTPLALFGVWVGDARSSTSSMIGDVADAAMGEVGAQVASPIADALGLRAESEATASADGDLHLRTAANATPDDDPFAAAAWAVAFAEAGAAVAVSRMGARGHGVAHRTETVSISAHFLPYGTADGSLTGRVTGRLADGHAVVQSRIWAASGCLVAITDQHLAVAPRFTRIH